MSETELNKITGINQISDADLISLPEGIRSSRSKGDWRDELSSQQKKIILSGLKDAESGNVISTEVFWNKLKEINYGSN